MLYSRAAKNQQIDSKFFRKLPDLESGSQFQMNKYLVDIEVRSLKCSMALVQKD